MNKEKLKGIIKNKTFIVGATSFFIGGIILGGGTTGVEAEVHNQVVIEVETLKTENTKLQEQVNQAKPYFEMKEEERVIMEAEAEEKRVAAEKKAAEAQAAADKAAADKVEADEKARLEEEKKGYDTGITFDQLARTPDDYIGKKVKFNGKVIQVMEGDGETQVRLAVNGDYDNVILAAWVDGTTGSRVLYDDNITISGLSGGLLTYKSTMGGEITIPQVVGLIVEQ